MGGGGGDSSSKRKSSKRKRHKTSSSQKKSRRKESKKRSRIQDLVSSHSDDESSNKETSKSDHKRIIHKNKKLRRDYSTSLSSSDDQSVSSHSDISLIDYSKRKKARRSRLNLESNKKRARPRSARPKDDGDAHSQKKRKRSSRDDVPKPKKKSSKKKPKKHLSTSSSSDSESKIILDKERERPRGRESYKSRKKRKIRSPRCSSRDTGSKHSDGALSPVNNNNNNNNNNNPRWLRSVIIVADQRYDEGEENRWEMDHHKEEIMYDENDYPSPKSLDSNEGGNKMELDNQSHGVSSKMIVIENIASDKGDQDNDGDRQLEAVDVNNFEKGEEIDTSVPPVASLGGDVLESILRQKALENLKKFKGRLQTGRTSTSLKMNNESDANRSSDVMVENVQNKLTKQGNSNAREMNQHSGLSKKRDLSQPTEVKKLSDSENVEKMNRNGGLSQKTDLSQPTKVKKLLDSENVEKMNRNSGLSQKRDLSQLKEVKKLSGSENVEKKSGMATQTVEHLTDGAALLECSEEGKYVISNAVSTEPVSRTNTCSGAETMNAGGTSITEPCSSIGTMTEEQSLERGNEAKDGSQFEQKTMSVMRGGEMVHVSYKVYIPKKSPALARRPLRR